jgi:hypothetical protein
MTKMFQNPIRWCERFAGLGWVVFLILQFACPSAARQTVEHQVVSPTKFHTGKDLDAKLQMAVSVTYSNARIREELVKFSRHQRVGLFIDRRIDPATSISLTASNRTVEQILWAIAEQTHLGVCRLGDVFYIGPVSTTESLPILWHKMKAESKRMQRRSQVEWSHRSVVTWPMLNQPAMLLSQLLEKNKIVVEKSIAADQTNDSGLIPHDVWPMIELPDLALDEQVALLLVGFNMWFERSENGANISLIKFPEVVHGQVEWPVPKDFKQKLAELKLQFPQCQLTLRGQVLSAVGSAQELAKIESTLVAFRVPQQGQEERYTLSTLATREQILATIADRTGRILVFEPELKRALDQRIELNIKNVTLEELIAEALQETNLRFILEPGRLSIVN